MGVLTHENPRIFVPTTPPGKPVLTSGYVDSSAVRVRPNVRNASHFKCSWVRSGGEVIDWKLPRSDFVGFQSRKPTPTPTPAPASAPPPPRNPGRRPSTDAASATLLTPVVNLLFIDFDNTLWPTSEQNKHSWVSPSDVAASRPGYDCFLAALDRTFQRFLTTVFNLQDLLSASNCSVLRDESKEVTAEAPPAMAAACKFEFHIVTNADIDHVRDVMKTFLPLSLAELCEHAVFNTVVVSARRSEKIVPYGLWKARAFHALIDESVTMATWGTSLPRLNVLSIGDGECERTAAFEMARTFRSEARTSVTSVQFMCLPTLEAIVHQLAVILPLLARWLHSPESALSHDDMQFQVCAVDLSATEWAGAASAKERPKLVLQPAKYSPVPMSLLRLWEVYNSSVGRLLAILATMKDPLFLALQVDEFERLVETMGKLKWRDTVQLPSILVDYSFLCSALRATGFVAPVQQNLRRCTAGSAQVLSSYFFWLLAKVENKDHTGSSFNPSQHRRPDYLLLRDRIAAICSARSSALTLDEESLYLSPSSFVFVYVVQQQQQQQAVRGLTAEFPDEEVHHFRQQQEASSYKGLEEEAVPRSDPPVEVLLQLTSSKEMLCLVRELCTRISPQSPWWNPDIFSRISTPTLSRLYNGMTLIVESVKMLRSRNRSKPDRSDDHSAVSDDIISHNWRT